MTDEITVNIKAAELFLSLYKETGDEYQKERAEFLADRIAKKVDATESFKAEIAGVV
jgi:hypothetical protein